MQRVMDEEKINRLIDAILVMQEREDTTTPALRSQLAETESSIGNILKAIEQGIFTPSTKQRLDELEARKEEILVNIQTAELQKPKRGKRCNRRQHLPAETDPHSGKKAERYGKERRNNAYLDQRRGDCYKWRQ